MVNQFKKEPFMNRIKDTGFLLKNSFTVIGKDKDIIKPTIRMIIFSVVILTLFFVSILSIFLGEFVFIGVLILLFTLFILIPWRFFYDVRQKACQSWIVYNTISGKDISYKDAHIHTKSEKSKLRLIAIIDMIMKYARNQGGNRRGFMGILITLFFAFLAEVWDLLSHYMLPAIVIERKSLKEVIPQLKQLRNNVPATLVGVFGIDFVGNVIGSLTFLIYLVFFAISVGIGVLLSSIVKTTIVTIAGISFSWVPVVIMLYIIFFCGIIIRKLVDSVKVIYFTIFYTSIMRPMEITPNMRNELTNYLLMQKPSTTSTVQQQTTQQAEYSYQEYIVKLADYFKTYTNQGYSENQIKDFLLSKGYAKADINSALNYLRSKS